MNTSRPRIEYRESDSKYVVVNRAFDTWEEARSHLWYQYQIWVI
jgi:hypothetical protein